MNRIKIAMLGVLGAFIASAPLEAKADSLPAIAGAAFLPSEAGCFSTPGFSNRVTNTACSGNRSWLVPMTLRWTGNTFFRASSAGSGTSPTCRFVLRTAGDSSFLLGGAIAVGAVDTYLGSANVSSVSVTGQIDCLMPQNGRGLSAVRWNTN